MVFIKGNLNALCYCDKILDPIVRPLLRPLVWGCAVFEQDHTHPHVARVCANFLEDNDVKVLLWPALHPDLNPVEIEWDLLSYHI